MWFFVLFFSETRSQSEQPTTMEQNKSTSLKLWCFSLRRQVRSQTTSRGKMQIFFCLHPLWDKREVDAGGCGGDVCFEHTGTKISLRLKSILCQITETWDKPEPLSSPSHASLTAVIDHTKCTIHQLYYSPTSPHLLEKNTSQSSRRPHGQQRRWSVCLCHDPLPAEDTVMTGGVVKYGVVQWLRLLCYLMPALRYCCFRLCNSWITSLFTAWFCFFLRKCFQCVHSWTPKKI